MIHLVKLCVGAETVEDLEVWQSRRARERKARGEPPNPIHETRQTPKRVDELLDGGSIYWVIKGTILVRQAVLAVNTLTDRNGRNYC